MTVYTVIGHITNAILTFEPLQIPSNLSGGPQMSWDFLRSQFMNYKGRFTCPECRLHLKFAFHGLSVDEVSHEKLLPDVIKTHVESHASESEIRVYNVSGEEMKANGAYGIRALFVK